MEKVSSRGRRQMHENWFLTPSVIGEDRDAPWAAILARPRPQHPQLCTKRFVSPFSRLLMNPAPLNSYFPFCWRGPRWRGPRWRPTPRGQSRWGRALPGRNSRRYRSAFLTLEDLISAVEAGQFLSRRRKGSRYLSRAEGKPFLVEGEGREIGS